MRELSFRSARLDCACVLAAFVIAGCGTHANQPAANPAGPATVTLHVHDMSERLNLL